MMRHSVKMCFFKQTGRHQFLHELQEIYDQEIRAMPKYM